MSTSFCSLPNIAKLAYTAIISKVGLATNSLARLRICPQTNPGNYTKYAINKIICFTPMKDNI